VDNKRTHHQAPQPEVRIRAPLDDDERKDMPIVFNSDNYRTLQSYSFSASVNDAKGEFSLTFYPDDDRATGDVEPVLDKIRILDIVEIYESRSKTGHKSTYADFTGVVRQKKYAVQMTDSGPRRSVSISGHSVAGLIQEFRISFDLHAMCLTDQTANTQELSIELTKALMREDSKPYPVKDAIEKIFESFLNTSAKNSKLSNCEVIKIAQKWMGEKFEDMFEVDDSKFYYPIASVFYGQNTQSFYDLVEGIVPKPLYEIFPYTKNGITKIKIRTVPFGDEWSGELDKNKKIIDSVLVKNFDIQQSDSEVYSVFYAYINGYPIELDKALVISTEGVKGAPSVQEDEGKFGKYGYRPLHISLHGFGSSLKDDGDTSTEDNIVELSKRLKEWYCKLDEMHAGNITMSTAVSEAMPQAGEKIAFLGGEFYVVSSRHQWNYGSNPETALSVSRGGDYSSGKFAELKNITRRYREFKDAIDKYKEFKGAV